MNDLVADMTVPFFEFAFMRRALVATLALALGAAPLGCLLVLRRMSLMGEAMAHAVLPGAAAAFLLAGLSLPAMSLGGFAAALLVAVAASAVARATPQKEDASFAAFYLMALALGVVMVSSSNGQADLLRLLFGSVLAVDDAALLQVAGVTTATLLLLALVYRPLVLAMLDPVYVRQLRARVIEPEAVMVLLLVANLVSAFQAMGTLMALGLMLLPAAAAQFWAATLPGQVAAAMGFGMAGGYAGLLLSFHAELPPGPCIVLACGALYAASLLLGRRHGLLTRPRREPAVPASAPS